MERASLDLGLGGHRASKRKSHMCSVLVSIHRFKNELCVAYLFRIMVLRTSYVTCVVCLYRLTTLRSSYVTCVACQSRLRA